jgi:DNA-binding transcriptional MerR regulator
MRIPYLAPGDVARRLGLSVSRITQLDREGKLPALRDSSGRRLFDPDVVERFALEREQRRAETSSPEAA